MAIIQSMTSVFSSSRNYDKKPIGFVWRSHTLFIVGTVGIGLFTDLFLYGLVVPILPFILQDSVGLPEEQVQSHVSGLLAAYAGASVLFSPVAGYIADKTKSRQAPYLGGLMALILATVLFFVGRSVPVLVVARILQGASSAFVWTVGLALCIDTVGPENLGKTIGSIFSFIAIGELFAPILGGVLYNKSGEGGVLVLALGVLVVDLLMRLCVIEKKVAARYDEKDPAAQTQDDSNDQHASEEADEEVDEQTSLLANGRKKESDEYLIPPNQHWFIQKVPILYCFTSPSLIAAQLVALTQAMILAAFDATIPTHAHDLFGFGSLKSGLLFVPLSIVNFAAGPIGGWFIDKYGTKPVAVFGFAYLVPILVLLRLPHADDGMGQVYVLGALMGLAGVGLGTIGSPSIVEAGAVVHRFYKRNPAFFGEQGPYASLYAFNSAIFCAGLSFGPLLGGGLKDAIGYGNMNAVLAGLSAFTAIASFFYLGGKPKSLRKCS